MFLSAGDPQPQRCKQNSDCTFQAHIDKTFFPSFPTTDSTIITEYKGICDLSHPSSTGEGQCKVATCNATATAADQDTECGNELGNGWSCAYAPGDRFGLCRKRSPEGGFCQRQADCNNLSSKNKIQNMVCDSGTNQCRGICTVRTPDTLSQGFPANGLTRGRECPKGQMCNQDSQCEVCAAGYCTDENPRDQSTGLQPSSSCDLRYAGAPSNSGVADWSKGYTNG